MRDARGERIRRGAGGATLVAGLLQVIGRRFGLKGILVLAVVVLAAWKLGLVDPQFLVEDGTGVGSTPASASPEEQERLEFVKVVLADTEDVWTAEFDRVGLRYTLPSMTVYRGSIRTGCGVGSSDMGPFYCPADATIYIDLSFYDELALTFESPGDFAQAYVVAHEVGHHVQNLLGTSDRVAAMRGRPDYNEYSVRLELQADYLAGVWANHSRQYLERGDIEEAMRAANAIGDDAIQRRMQGRVVPHSFTHGTSEQRMRWFTRGLETGTMEGGDTFAPDYGSL